MSTQKPIPNDLVKILSPLLEAESSQVILKPLCPTEHGNYYVTARRPGLCLSVLKERISNGEYPDTWVMLLELVILLEDSLRYLSYPVSIYIWKFSVLFSYFQDDPVNSQHINSLLQILHTSLHSSTTQRDTPTSTAVPIYSTPVNQGLTESQKAHHYSIINQLYQFISTGSDSSVSTFGI